MKGITFILFHRKALFFHYLHYFSTKFITFPSPWRVWWRSPQPSWSKHYTTKKQEWDEWDPAELKALWWNRSSWYRQIFLYYIDEEWKALLLYFSTERHYFSITYITFPRKITFPSLEWRSQQPSWSEHYTTKKQEWDVWVDLLDSVDVPDKCVVQVITEERKVSSLNWFAGVNEMPTLPPGARWERSINSSCPPCQWVLLDRWLIRISGNFCTCLLGWCYQ